MAEDLSFVVERLFEVWLKGEFDGVDLSDKRLGWRFNEHWFCKVMFDTLDLRFVGDDFFVFIDHVMISTGTSERRCSGPALICRDNEISVFVDRRSFWNSESSVVVVGFLSCVFIPTAGGRMVSLPSAGHAGSGCAPIVCYFNVAADLNIT